MPLAIFSEILTGNSGEGSMKRTLLCSLGLLILTTAALSQTGKTEKAIAALEQQWLQSQKTNNVDLLPAAG
jgi:hypothetical protein